jgi:geranylgeranyl diphosphate synthase, type II
MSAAHKLTTEIHDVPQDSAVRHAIRDLASDIACQMDASRLPTRGDLESSADDLLNRLNLPRGFLGYAMVAVSNELWRQQFESIPFNRRLLLLPHCLHDESVCQAEPDASDYRCANCGGCDIGSFKEQAEGLGYQVVTAEGTSSVVMKILQGDADALLGVACLDSLERSYTRVADLGIPHIAVPLLHNGCVKTQAETEELLRAIHAASDQTAQRRRSYLPLLRETARIFEQDSLVELLPSDVGRCLLNDDPAPATEKIALEWLGSRGKRLRPFLTTASFAVAVHGTEALSPDAEHPLPSPIKRIALAIEALHKASLVHDDIEDDDDFRYGKSTLHREYGIAPAINVGDYLVGLGYRLIAGEAKSLGAECVADILRVLSSAHLELCRGQGQELLRKGESLQVVDVMSIYAAKTSPALEVALCAGLRAAGVQIDEDLLRRFCMYLGEGYQILNDLDDWRSDDPNRVNPGGDALAQRPTILLAFALEAGGEDLRPILKSQAEVERLRELYEKLGAFDRADKLVDRLRGRARQLTQDFSTPAIRELMAFIVGLILPGESRA